MFKYRHPDWDAALYVVPVKEPGIDTLGMSVSDR